MPNLLRKIVRSFGMDIVGYPPADTRAAHLAHLLNHQGVDFVFDIGANRGQYASALRRAGYGGGIVSVEPVSNAHDALLSAAATDANWQVAPRLAVGPFEGEVTIHVSNRSDMSSVLPMREETLIALPKSYYVGEEQVEQVTLDALFDRYGQGAKRPFIKIDTQGYEGRILESGTGALAAVHGLQLEMSLVPPLRRRSELSRHPPARARTRLRAASFPAGLLFEAPGSPVASRRGVFPRRRGRLNPGQEHPAITGSNPSRMSGRHIDHTKPTLFAASLRFIQGTGGAPYFVGHRGWRAPSYGSLGRSPAPRAVPKTRDFRASLRRGGSLNPDRARQPPWPRRSRDRLRCASGEGRREWSATVPGFRFRNDALAAPYPVHRMCRPKRK